MYSEIKSNKNNLFVKHHVTTGLSRGTFYVEQVQMTLPLRASTEATEAVKKVPFWSNPGDCDFQLRWEAICSDHRKKEKGRGGDEREQKSRGRQGTTIYRTVVIECRSIKTSFEKIFKGGH